MMKWSLTTTRQPVSPVRIKVSHSPPPHIPPLHISPLHIPSLHILPLSPCPASHHPPFCRPHPSLPCSAASSAFPALVFLLPVLVFLLVQSSFWNLSDLSASGA